MKLQTICIDTKQASIVLGKSISHARTIIRAIKDSHKKKSYQPVTIKEFCDYMDLPYEEVFNMVNNINDASTSKSA